MKIWKYILPQVTIISKNKEEFLKCYLLTQLTIFLTINKHYCFDAVIIGWGCFNDYNGVVDHFVEIGIEK